MVRSILQATIALAVCGVCFQAAPRPDAVHATTPSSLAEAPLAGDTKKKLELKKGDRICYIGNTLADRMQHFGWLETYIQHRFPKKQLVFRNLGFSGDTLTVRPRSSNFGSPDSHLRHSKASVVFAFFGYNESFAGENGLQKFRNDLSNFIDHTRKQKYDGVAPPRIVIFSPIAHEDLKSPHLPDGKENNKRLAMYTKAMAEVAEQKGVVFVDLFTPTKKLYGQAQQPLTLNGVHLTGDGYQLLAEAIDRKLFGKANKVQTSKLERIRKAVLNKNLHWFNRYRTTDGYNIFGGRGRAGRGPDGLNNAKVLNRELEILDVMTANRDKLVWALAQGKEYKVDDSNTPPPLNPVSNRKGDAPDGKFKFLGGQEAIKKMTVAKGMKVSLFADEKQFPELVNPVQMSFDTDGRLWVAAWPTYPHWNPKKEMNDKLLIFPDEDGDGKADKCIVFADNLHNPTGFEFWNGGVLVAQAPDIIFLKDTDGDDKADVRIHILHGIDSADTHHTANSFILGPAGHLYFQRGVFHVTNVESPWGPAFRSNSTGMYRFDLKSHKLTRHFGMGPNPHGNAFDKWGFQFATDGTTGHGFYIGFPGRGAPKQLYRKRVRPVPGIGILSSQHFPKENQGNLLIANVIGFQGITQYKFVNEGAGFWAEEIEPILYSSDRNFRPSSVEVGADGSLFIIDWQNPLIGHLQHNLRDPNRDHQHGRVYRVTVKGRPLEKVVKMKGKPIAEVVGHLSSPTLGVRYRAKIELTGRDSKAVVKAVQKWAKQFDPSKKEDALSLVEALWVHQQHRVVNPELLKRALASVEPNARAAAVRVLQDWGNKMKGAGSLLVKAAGDKHPRVRAEAVVAASFYDGPEAAEVIFEAERWPKDVQLDYVLKQTRSMIDIPKFLAEAKKSGRKLSPAAEAFVLRNASVPDLLKMDRTAAVYRAILTRSNVPVKYLNESLTGLAKIEKKSKVTLLLDFIEELDAKQQASSLPSLAKLLAIQPEAKLQGAKARVEKLATTGNAKETRQAGLVAWVVAEGSPKLAFAHALKSKKNLREFLETIPQIPTKELRAKLDKHLRPLLFQMPKRLAEKGGTLSKRGLKVDYFEPNPREKNVAIETLARYKPAATGIVPEVKFDVPILKRRDAFALRFTGSLNIQRTGKYKFSLGSDDGSRLYIGGRLVINNDGLHGMKKKKGVIRLQAGEHSFVLTYFDNGGGDGLSLTWSGPGFRNQKIDPKNFSIPGKETLTDLVIRSLEFVPGNEKATFTDLAKLIRDGKNRESAVRVIRKLPTEAWAKNQIPALAESLAKQVRQIPAKYRTSKSALEAMELVDELAETLPKEKARAFRAKIASLKIQVFRIGTVPHRMIYDKDRIVVEAGKTVEFILSNSDQMPHNFAIVEPGFMEKVGLLAEATAQQPDVQARHYIPRSDKILLSSRLLNTGDTQALSFDVPNTPGVYSYVCTYPGHWRRMYGALYVVKDVKAYYANPEEYLKKNNIQIKDELLNYSTKGQEWAFEDLAESIQKLKHGRSFDVGKRAFKVANCIACHRMNKEGMEFGPDLTKLDMKKRNSEYILKSILHPSKDIDKKYQSYAFLLRSGKVVAGLIVKETPKKITVLPAASWATKQTVDLKTSEIKQRKKIPQSIMPEGLLNRLSREEILDLVTYVQAAGNERSAMFQKHKHD